MKNLNFIFTEDNIETDGSDINILDLLAIINICSSMINEILTEQHPFSNDQS